MTEEKQYRNSYELISRKLQEMTANMTPEQKEAKWGPDKLKYLQNAESIIEYLRIEKRKVEKRREKVPELFYAQTENLTFPELKKWYSENSSVENGGRKYKEIVYRERMLELVAKKFGIEIPRTPEKGTGRIISSKVELHRELDTDPKTKYMIGLCGGDDVDMADIIAVVYDGRITRDDAIKFLQDSALRAYLGEIKKPEGLVDIILLGENLLPFDKNGVISSIIYKRLIENRRSELGARPTPEQCDAYQNKIKRILEDLV